MLIENMKTKETWNSIVIHLKPSEAKELRDSLDAILDDQTPGRHEHVSSDDYQKEITILICDKQ